MGKDGVHVGDATQLFANSVRDLIYTYLFVTRMPYVRRTRIRASTRRLDGFDGGLYVLT